MKLKEFDLWGYKLELKESRAFTLFNRSVCAHFERHFSPMETKNFYRIVIKLNDEVDERIGRIEVSGPTLMYYEKFDFGTFYTLSEALKKKKILDSLYGALMHISEVNGWDKAGFEYAYDSVVREKFENVYTVKKINNKKRTLLAELRCEHRSSSFDCFVTVKNKTGEIVLEELAFSEEPDEFLFNGRIGSIKWLTNDTLVHFKRDKTEIKRYDLSGFVESGNT